MTEIEALRAVWEAERDRYAADMDEMADDITALTAERDRLREALEDMIGLASGGAARAHLDQAGVMQDPPHGCGTFAECPAPWCVRNRRRLAGAEQALDALDILETTSETGGEP